MHRSWYLGAQFIPARSFEKESRILNLDIKLNKGTQFVLGVLPFTGLTPADQTKAVKLWQLREGAPLDGPYIDDYLRGVFKALDGSVTPVSKELRRRANGKLIDVALTFQ